MSTDGETWEPWAGEQEAGPENPAHEPGVESDGYDESGSIPMEGDTGDGTAAPEGPGVGNAEAHVGGSVEAQLMLTVGSIQGMELNLGERWIEQFSVDHVEALQPSALDRILAEVSPDPRIVERGLAILKSTRLLCVVGEPRSGRGTLGLAVAQRLLLHRDVESALLCRPLEAQVRVRPLRMSAQLKGEQHRLLVFEDALAHGNRDLQRFLHDLAAGELELVSSSLATDNTWLLFTLDHHGLGRCGRELGRHGVVFELPPPQEAQVMATIRREAGRLESTALGSEEIAAAVDKLLSADGSALCSRFRGLPDVVRFCRLYLPAVLEKRIELHAALEELCDLSAWFLDKAAQDRETWCELLALTLASSTPATATVPWLAHRNLTRVLSESLRSSLTEEDTPRKPVELFASPLEEARLARIERRPNPEGDALRFEERELAERLWSVLLGRGRSVSWWLAPRLDELAFSNDPVLARMAARALGRIGELAPESLTHARLRRWAEWPAKPRRPVPHLFEGVLASRSQEYREGVLDWMRRQLRHGRQSETWAACTCLPILADHSPDLALDELFGALDDRFGGDEDQRQDVSRRLAAAAVAARQDLRHQQLDRLQAWSTAGIFRKATEQVFLVGTEYALVGFCFASSRMDVLRRLCERLTRSGDPVSLLLTMMFFEPKGVLDTVERYPVYVRDDAGLDWSAKACSRLLASAMVEDAADDLAQFFEICWQRLSEVPDPFRRSLRDRVVDQLRRWSREPPEGMVGDTLGALLGRLVESTDDQLASRVFSLLQADPAFAPGAPAEWLAERALSVRSA